MNNRYLPLSVVEPHLKKLSNKFKVEICGKSVENKKIFSVSFGQGNCKVMAWSQMHGNETTTTKAMLDFFELLETNTNYAQNIAQQFTLLFIPILNPDGAEAYTRKNTNQIDLNRDALEESQPETQTLKNVFKQFKPHFCLNLHGQRTLFGVGDTKKPAVLSFLAPSDNYTGKLSSNRRISMSLIAYMSNKLNPISGKIGLYNDTYNPNCTGDFFQTQGVPTILFEAGHQNNDYSRAETRKNILEALQLFFEGVELTKNVDLVSVYKKIPQNTKSFFDVLVKNVQMNDRILDMGYRYEEVLKDKKIKFSLKFKAVGDLRNFGGHIEFEYPKTKQNKLQLTPLMKENNFIKILEFDIKKHIKPS